MAVPKRQDFIEYLGENYRESDEELIKLYLATHKFYRKLEKEVRDQPMMYEYTNKAGAENLVKNPLIPELTKVVQTLNNLLKSMGLTPAQRKKAMAGGEVDDEFDKF
ncbi:P27 family phage terminase small subunit [Geomicrobium sp. JCM 19038]|uniref:P27 family phage terminase small subunit n=1 Tax=Geomicrobium sp. JCM 19038 TaxID=1460635 RepID=UPI0005A897AB|nr:P27 family phage terminase small subunit [Geomicrobium sp. JCM 19038]